MRSQNDALPRVGVPWRTALEEAAGGRAEIDRYLRAVAQAGGDPVPVSLASTAAELARQAAELDAFVLSGSPADIDPAVFHAKRHPATTTADPARERTDFALLDHALAQRKPLLAICYGIQSLNVFLGGTLAQDIPSEIGSQVCHESPNETSNPSSDAIHGAQFEAGHVMELCGAPDAMVNSSHHQAILEPGRGLRITARAPDGVVEAVEWTGDANWVVGVQWHPERMTEDPLAAALFRSFVQAARHSERSRIT